MEILRGQADPPVMQPTLLRLAPILCIAACATNPVAVSTLENEEGWTLRERNALAGDDLSAETLRILGSRGLLAVLDEEDDPRRLLATLRSAALPEPDGSVVIAECLMRAERDLAPDEAARCILEAALVAWDAMARPWSPDPAFDDRFVLLRRLYNAAVARLIELEPEPSPGARLGTLDGALELRAGVDSGCWPLDYFDALVPAHRLEISGIRTRHLRSGAGAALVGVRDNSGRLRPAVPHLPPEGIVHPVSAVLRPGTAGIVELALFNSFDTDTIALGERRASLEADFTAPYAYLIASSRLHEFRRTGFFSPDSARTCQGVYMLQPYDPERIPVLMIHGLRSSPLTWRELTNEVWGDPVLRVRYQVWHFLYTTGTPILNNARELRVEMAKIRRQIDPDDGDPATQDIVLVGHSMGGVLAKTVVQSSGDTVWDARFTKPIAALSLEQADREHAEATYFFAPLPWVRRVIFIAAPHRGSEVADSLVGRVGSGLITLPERVSGFAERLLERNPGAMRPGAFSAPSSVDVLSPRHPVLQTLAALPIAEHVTYHSIIGDLEGGSAGTDGVVPYSSAHLAGAESEIVIHGDHAVNESAAAIREVIRILHEHARRSRSYSPSSIPDKPDP